MTPINGQRLFYLNPQTIWAGEDLESCIIGMCSGTGTERDDIVKEPRELTDDEVSAKFGRGRTLARELTKALDKGLKTPVFFAEVEQVEEPEPMEIKPMKGMLLPPKSDTCPVCATKHEPEMPHNQPSLYYQMRFKGLHGRWPTWADAAAHCTPQVRDQWKQALAKMRFEWTAPEDEPISEPPAAFKHQIVEV